MASLTDMIKGLKSFARTATVAMPAIVGGLSGLARGHGHTGKAPLKLLWDGNAEQAFTQLRHNYFVDKGASKDAILGGVLSTILQAVVP